MAVHGVLADHQPHRYLLVRESLGDERQHLERRLAPLEEASDAYWARRAGLAWT